MYKEYPKFYWYEVLDYGRKSRFDDPLLTVEEQLEKHEKILDEYALKHFGATVPKENKYREIGSGETIKDRPEINKVLKRIEDPKIKAVMVVDVQRLSRGDLEDAGRLIKLLRYTNTYVITPMKIYDLRDEYDRDAFERELKRGSEYLEYYKKIQLRGKLSSVREGNYIGSVAPYGFDRIKKMYPDGKRHYWTLTEKKEEADVVRMVFNWFCNDGIGVSNICRKLEKLGVAAKSGKIKWTPGAIYNMLENVHYTGYVRWNWRKVVKIIEDQEVKVLRPHAKVGEYLVFNGKHDGIVSEEIFERAKQIRGNGPRNKVDLSLKNALSGLIFCECGHTMVHNSYVNKGSVISPPKLKCNNQVRCKSGSVDYKELLDRVLITIEESIEDFEIRVINHQDDSSKLHKSLIDSLERKLKVLEEKEMLQWEAQYDPDPAKRMPPEIFKSLNEKLRKEKSDLQEALSEAQESIPEQIDYNEKIIKFTEVLNIVRDEDVSVELKNQYLKDIIERINYKRPQSVMVTKKNYKELGYDTIKKGLGWHSYPFEIDVHLR